MSVLIKGMEMPTCCDECFAFDNYRGGAYCDLTKTNEYGYFWITKERMHNCPLVEVKDPCDTL